MNSNLNSIKTERGNIKGEIKVIFESKLEVLRTDVGKVFEESGLVNIRVTTVENDLDDKMQDKLSGCVDNCIHRQNTFEEATSKSVNNLSNRV